MLAFCSLQSFSLGGGVRSADTALGCSTPAIVCGKQPVHRSHASLLPRCCLGSSSPALVCDSSPPAAKESNPCRLCGPLAAPVRASRRERTSCNSAAPSRESSERDATGTTGIRRRRVLRHLQLRGLGPEAHARLEHVHAQVSRRVVGRSRVVDARDGAPAPRDERSSKNYPCLSGPLFPSEPGYHQAASIASR